MKPKVFVTRVVAEPGLEKLRQSCEVSVWSHKEPATPGQIREAVHDCEGILAVTPDRVDQALLDSAPRLKVVANNGVGVDNIDLIACRKRNVAVGNTPDVLTESTADMAWALLMAAARRVPKGDRFVREGRRQNLTPTDYWGVDIGGATLGIIGMGCIGQAVARRGRGFDMKILYCSRSAHPDAEAETGASRVELDTLLQSSDFVLIHCSLTEQTRGLINAERLQLMKPTAVLVNTARGGIIDQAALGEALKSGFLGGAGLDVFEREPLPLDDPLIDLRNVVLMPHVGSATEKTRIKMSLIAAENILAGLRGEPLPCPVTL